MAIKPRLKDAWWALKGRSLANPPLPSRVESILFVCLGNICRSPFAAVLAERRCRDRGWTSIRCASAGIRTKQGNRVPDEGRAVAEATYGLSLVDHRPQTMTADLVDDFDLIVVMEAGQLAHLRAAYPQARGRIVLLSLFDVEGAGAYERYHIDDPFGQPRAAFEHGYRRIDRAVDHLLDAIAAARR